jgi:hypothetical protein
MECFPYGDVEGTVNVEHAPSALKIKSTDPVPLPPTTTQPNNGITHIHTKPWGIPCLPLKPWGIPCLPLHVWPLGHCCSAWMRMMSLMRAYTACTDGTKVNNKHDFALI